MLSWANIAESATAIEYTGYGYYLSEQAGRDILAGWSSDRTEKEVYKAALDDMHYEWQLFKASMESQIADIREAHQEEREEWQKALRKSRSPGLGIFLGAGYGSRGETEVVIGVGLVWKVF